MRIEEALSKAIETKYLKESKEEINAFITKYGQDLYDRFKKLQNRIKNPQNDFSYWIGKKNTKTKEDLVSLLDTTENTKSKNKLTKDIMQEYKAKAKYKEIYNKNGWRVLNIFNYEAAVYFGQGTTWCISGNYLNLPSDASDEEIEKLKAEGREKGLSYFNDYLGMDENGEWYDEPSIEQYEDYYFILHGKDKWCYVTYTYDDDESFNLEDVTLFYDADNNTYNLFDIPLIEKKIPTDVLDALPYLGSLLSRRAVVEDGKYYYDTEMVLDYNLYDKVTEIIIPTGTLRLEHLNDFRNLDCVTFQQPCFVRIIDYDCFQASQIQSIEIPASVEEIKGSAFMSSALQHILFKGDSLTYIGSYAFSNTHLTTITIPQKVKEIKNNAFSKTPIKTIYVDGKYRPEIFDKDAVDRDDVVINWTFENIKETFGEMLAKRKNKTESYERKHHMWLKEDKGFNNFISYEDAVKIKNYCNTACAERKHGIQASDITIDSIWGESLFIDYYGDHFKYSTDDPLLQTQDVTIEILNIFGCGDAFFDVDYLMNGLGTTAIIPINNRKYISQTNPKSKKVATFI